MAKRKTTETDQPAPSEGPQPKASRPKRAAGADTVYQLKITLRDIRPPIWRRVQVRGCSLATLHGVIQTLMDWDDYHLYAFEIGDAEYGDPDRTGGELDMEDAGRTKLSKVIPGEKFKFRYTYDFGDNWEHDIVVEKILPAEPGQDYPVCLAGKRAGPPEDCGGPWGYMEYAESTKGPDSEQDEEPEWGDEFDPEAFDLEAVNRALRQS